MEVWYKHEKLLNTMLCAGLYFSRQYLFCHRNGQLNWKWLIKRNQKKITIRYSTFGFSAFHLRHKQQFFSIILYTYPKYGRSPFLRLTVIVNHLQVYVREEYVWGDMPPSKYSDPLLSCGMVATDNVSHPSSKEVYLQNRISGQNDLHYNSLTAFAPKSNQILGKT